MIIRKIIFNIGRFYKITKTQAHRMQLTWSREGGGGWGCSTHGIFRVAIFRGKHFPAFVSNFFWLSVVSINCLQSHRPTHAPVNCYLGRILHPKPPPPPPRKKLLRTPMVQADKTMKVGRPTHRWLPPDSLSTCHLCHVHACRTTEVSNSFVNNWRIPLSANVKYKTILMVTDNNRQTITGPDDPPPPPGPFYQLNHLTGLNTGLQLS